MFDFCVRQSCGPSRLSQSSGVDCTVTDGHDHLSAEEAVKVEVQPFPVSLLGPCLQNLESRFGIGQKALGALLLGAQSHEPGDEKTTHDGDKG